MEIEFYTNEQLIQELAKRQTFVGLILHSKDNQISTGQVHSKFQMYTNLSRDQITMMLGKVQKTLQQ